MPALYLLWWMLVGSFARAELLVGVAAAVIGACALCTVERAERRRFRPRLDDAAQGVYVVWLLVQGTWEILKVSIRDLLGGRKAVSAFRVVKFDAGETESGRDTARRVLAVAYTTMAPNFIVLGVNGCDGQMLFHQIERSDPPEMTKNLGARA